MPSAANDLLTSLLRDVSRSFYLTLRILPASVRSQIGLAYLLARATDTVADTELVAIEARLGALRQLREAILAQPGTPASAAPDFSQLASQQGNPAEQVLLQRVGDALTVLRSFSPADQALIREVLTTITSGQLLDLERFHGASADRIVALQTAGELDDYTYRVAGCVGEFWTKICRAQVFPQAKLDDTQLLADGIRFGKGLQLVNILRDLPKDLRQGRCYLPADRLSQMGLKPQDLLKTGSGPKLLPVFGEQLSLAWAHLDAGWAYTCRIPWRQMRVRLACAWPVLIGYRTLDRLAVLGSPVTGGPVKVPRSEVKRLIASTILLYALPGIWQKLAPLKHGKQCRYDPTNDF